MEFLNNLKARLPDVTVLMLSVGDKEQEIEAGLAGGASEYLVKGGPAGEIVDAIKRYGPVPVWALEAWEEQPPAGGGAICWRLVTTEPLDTWADARRALREYLLRGLIERLHDVLKSGCRIEQLQLTSADRLANAVAVYSQVAVRILRLTYRLRLEPDVAATEEFSAEELAVL